MLDAFKLLVGSCQHVFLQYSYKTIILSKKVKPASTAQDNTIIHQHGIVPRYSKYFPVICPTMPYNAADAEDWTVRNQIQQMEPNDVRF